MTTIKLGDYVSAVVSDPTMPDAVTTIDGIVTHLFDLDDNPHATVTDTRGKPRQFIADIQDVEVHQRPPHRLADQDLQIRTRAAAIGHHLSTDVDIHHSARANETRVQGSCTCGFWDTPAWDEDSVTEAFEDHLYALANLDTAPRLPRLCTCTWHQPATGGRPLRLTMNVDCVLHAPIDDQLLAHIQLGAA
ncbi:hypothetical protein ACIBG8_54555 [Nonomuraea sp. NPDC050556]|uniref:hypothetical protein n=1 Tax=Nonomuraea sp. NPDC050556 TaxID=3364369 RepID=UPI003799D510